MVYNLCSVSRELRPYLTFTSSANIMLRSDCASSTAYCRKWGGSSDGAHLLHPEKDENNIPSVARLTKVLLGLPADIPTCP